MPLSTDQSLRRSKSRKENPQKLSLPRNSVARSTDRHDMTRGKQQQLVIARLIELFDHSLFAVN